MIKILAIILIVFAVIHGLIHLMGFAAYWPLAKIDQLPYKTTLLNGRWEVAPGGDMATIRTHPGGQYFLAAGDYPEGDLDLGDSRRHGRVWLHAGHEPPANSGGGQQYTHNDHD